MTRLSARPAKNTNGTVVALADVRAQGNSPAAATAAPVPGFIGSAAEAGPRDRDRDQADAVDILLLAVGARDAEGCGLLAELECDVGHGSTLPAVRARCQP